MEFIENPERKPHPLVGEDECHSVGAKRKPKLLYSFPLPQEMRNVKPVELA
jgi:hypothetical protein